MKSMSQLQTVSDIKGMHSVGARSIPKSMRSNYLELYVLDREMSRVEKEKYALDKRRENAKTRLASVAKRMEKIKKEIETKEVKTHRGADTGIPLKKMPIGY
jgi:chromosome segregation ATPase